MKTAISLTVFVIWTLVAQAQAKATTDTKHEEFDAVLKAHVVDGVVDYASIKKDARFSNYLNVLGNTNPDGFATDAEKLAFWINAYNALAIKGILDGRSPSGFFGRIGYFKTTDYQVAGRSINLYDLERDIIIPFGEPRIHFAIVCASQSCPKLRSEAYVASRLGEQLEDNTRAFMNDPHKNTFDTDKKIAKVSKIFDWFDEDFEKHSGSVQEFVSKYLDDKSIAEQLSQENFRVKHLKYDWNLNGTPPM